MIPAARTIATSSDTSAATPTAGTEAPATAFDAILSLETVAAQIATDTVAVAPLSLEGVCLEGFDDEELEDTEDGEGFDALEFLADLLNVAAVPRQVPVQDSGGELAANDDVMSGSTGSSAEELPAIGSNVTAAGKDAAADKLPGQAIQPAAPPAVLTETGVEFVDAAQPVDEVTSLSRAAEWVAGPRHAPAAPERSGIATHARDPRWAEEFGTRIALMVRGGESSASLQLSPVELGPMDVNVTIRDSQASIHFGAAQAETRALIEASLPRLREMLAAQGFQLMDSSVSQGFARDRREGNAPGVHAAVESETSSHETSPVRSLSLLDIYA